MFIRFPSKLVQTSFPAWQILLAKKGSPIIFTLVFGRGRGFPQKLLFSGPQGLVCVKITLYHLHVVRKISVHHF